MPIYVDKADLSAQQRKGLKFFASTPPGTEIAGEGSFQSGEAFATAVLRVLGDKGYAAREAAKADKRREVYAGAANQTDKATIEAAVLVAFPDAE